MVTSLPGLVFQKTIRGVKKARKQAQRGAKFARYVAGRVRSAEKSLYFHLRDTRAGQVLLRAATFAGGGRELRGRQRLAATHIRQTGEPLIDDREPNAGKQIGMRPSLDTIGGESRLFTHAVIPQPTGDDSDRSSDGERCSQNATPVHADPIAA